MNIVFKSITLKNLNSFGNNETTLNIKNGMSLITGSNGSGKSSFVLDALCYNLFGDPYRDIKRDELINRDNGKGLYTKVVFNISKDEYVVERGRKPDIFSVTKNGEPIELDSTRKLEQDSLNKILGIEIKLFKNIVALAVVKNFSFLGLSLPEKRKMLESIFNIDVLGFMASEVKKRSGKNKTEREIAYNSLSAFNSSKGILENSLNNIKKQIEMFEQNKQINIDKINTQINFLMEKAETLNDEYEALNKKLEDLPPQEDKKQLLEDRDACIAELNQVIAVVNECNRKLKEVDGDVGAICEHCGSVIDEAHLKAHVDDINEKLSMANDYKNSLLETKDEMDSKWRSLDDLEKKRNNLTKEIEFKKHEIDTVLANIMTLNENLESVENSVNTLDTIETETKIKNLERDIKTREEEVTHLDGLISMDKTISEILSDKGIKTYFMKKLIPLLNQRVNYYFDKFNFGITIEFDELCNATISKGRFTTSYHQYSNGEMCRIDMAILFAFVDISKIISGWSCNLLIIDELLDSGTDEEGLDKFLLSLREMSESQNDMAVYLISHKIDKNDVNWSSTVEVSKNGLFSEIEVKE